MDKLHSSDPWLLDDDRIQPSNEKAEAHEFQVEATTMPLVLQCGWSRVHSERYELRRFHAALRPVGALTASVVNVTPASVQQALLDQAMPLMSDQLPGTVLAIAQ